MEQSHFLEANGRSSTSEISRFLRRTKFHYSGHNSLPLIHIMIQFLVPVSFKYFNPYSGTTKNYTYKIIMTQFNDLFLCIISSAADASCIILASYNLKISLRYSFHLLPNNIFSSTFCRCVCSLCLYEFHMCN